MKKKILLAAALISIFNFQFSISHAQNNPVVIEIGGRQIRQQEFMKDFMQSVGNGLVAQEATESARPSTNMWNSMPISRPSCAMP